MIANWLQSQYQALVSHVGRFTARYSKGQIQLLFQRLLFEWNSYLSGPVDSLILLLGILGVFQNLLKSLLMDGVSFDQLKDSLWQRIHLDLICDQSRKYFVEKTNGTVYIHSQSSRACVDYFSEKSSISLASLSNDEALLAYFLEEGENEDEESDVKADFIKET